jgi:AcrR family transcriptional regulator
LLRQARKGDVTRQMIIARTAAVLNQQGYHASSLADIMAATGLEKGGIYHHFRGKDDLALAAFDYAIELVWQRLRTAMRHQSNAADRLIALARAYQDMADDPPLPGGCPILNTGVEASGTHPALRARARAAMDALLHFVEKVIARGQERGEIRSEVVGTTTAPLFIGTIEGGLLLARLYDDPTFVHGAVDQVVHLIEADLRVSM